MPPRFRVHRSTCPIFGAILGCLILLQTIYSFATMNDLVSLLDAARMHRFDLQAALDTINGHDASLTRGHDKPFVRAAVVYLTSTREPIDEDEFRWFHASWADMVAHQPLMWRMDLVVFVEEASLPLLDELGCTLAIRQGPTSMRGKPIVNETGPAMMSDRKQSKRCPKESVIDYVSLCLLFHHTCDDVVELMHVRLRCKGIRCCASKSCIVAYKVSTCNFELQ
ncbi:Aste57867_25056 [Aphanomyces stellatus]|uniref:Aste57867_25056 protein n=1 Tax=Aphanomyces stellatus TaxID=120398 RepID=A0A485LS64_9STRA|nr:hypothetical protein As57867_024978 [Aphanomyces stellatus]VFU01687.1 Aste57867_25056 [Aphanomyces stellatus]